MAYMDLDYMAVVFWHHYHQFITILRINMIKGISISNLKDVLDDEWVDVLGDLVEQKEVSKSLNATT